MSLTTISQRLPGCNGLGTVPPQKEAGYGASMKYYVVAEDENPGLEEDDLGTAGWSFSLAMQRSQTMNELT